MTKHVGAAKVSPHYSIGNSKVLVSLEWRIRLETLYIPHQRGLFLFIFVFFLCIDDNDGVC